MEKTLGNANADAVAEPRIGWLTSPNGRSKLRRTDSSSGNAGQWCWDKNLNTILGNPAFATTNVPNNLTEGSGTNLIALLCGEWSNVLVNLFKAVDILFNPYAQTTLGYFSINAYQECDVQVRARRRLRDRKRHDHDVARGTTADLRESDPRGTMRPVSVPIRFVRHAAYDGRWRSPGEETDVHPDVAASAIERGDAVTCGVEITALRTGPLVGTHVISKGEQLTASAARAEELCAAERPSPGGSRSNRIRSSATIAPQTTRGEHRCKMTRPRA